MYNYYYSEAIYLFFSSYNSLIKVAIQKLQIIWYEPLRAPSLRQDKKSISIKYASEIIG